MKVCKNCGAEIPTHKNFCNSSCRMYYVNHHDKEFIRERNRAATETIEYVNSNPEILERKLAANSEFMANRNREAGEFKSNNNGMTPSELFLYNIEEFRRLNPQHNYYIGFIDGRKTWVDFVIGSLALELDGSAHFYYDEDEERLREDRIRKAGFSLLRISSKDLFSDTEQVVRLILERINA